MFLRYNTQQWRKNGGNIYLVVPFLLRGGGKYEKNRYRDALRSNWSRKCGRN